MKETKTTNKTYPKNKKEIQEEGQKLFRIIDEESPRSIAIMGVAYLDSLLKKLLKRVLIDNKDVSNIIEKNLNFSSLINLSYAMGLIDETAKKELIIVNNIRNKFAHHMEFDSFEKDEIKKDCKKLNIHINYNTSLVSSQELYKGAISYYSGYLIVKWKHCKRLETGMLFQP